MPESLEDILKNGYQTWRNNLNISLPFFFNLIVSLVFLAIVVLFIFLIFGSIAYLGSPLPLTNQLYEITSFTKNLPFFIIFVITAIVIIIVILSLIDAFFEAGAIGMAKVATQKHKTTLDDMIKYGKKKFLSLFFANILVGLITIGGALILAFIFIGIPALLGILSRTTYGLNIQSLLLIILGICIAFLYILTTSIIFYPVKYALVISDLGAIDALKRGYKFFMNNKLHVFLLWLIVIVISIAFSVATSILQFPFRFIPVIGAIMSIIISILTTLISLLIIAPLTTVWWTYFYLDRTTNKKVSPTATPPTETPFLPTSPLQTQLQNRKEEGKEKDEGKEIKIYI
jgi:hypothetical protein